jgi:diguanylate cyclase (GGDEF)-like protein
VTRVRTAPRRALSAPWPFAVAIGCLASIVFLVGNTLVQTVVCLAGLVAAAGSMVAGLRLHRPESRLPWALLGVTGLLFVISSVGHPRGAWVAGGVLLRLGVHIASTAGHLLGTAAVLLLVRRAGRPKRDVWLDCMTVVVSAGTVIGLLLCWPALTSPGHPLWESLFQALYPLLDLIVLAALLLLGFTADPRLVSYRTLVGTTLCLLGAGALLGRLPDGQGLGTTVLGLLGLIGCTLFAVTALHPSMVELSRARPEPPQLLDSPPPEWTVHWMLLFLPALMLPPFLLASGRRSGAQVVVLAAATAVVQLLLLLRTYGALRVATYAHQHDRLTGLPTRELFLARLTETMRQLSGDSDALWVAVVDLDEHRQIVHSWGHQTGDAVIRLVGQQLQQLLPPGSNVARLDGDIFGVELRGTSLEAAAGAEAIRASLDGLMDVDGLELVTTASVGLAPETLPGDPVRLLRDADTAMNAARSLGGNRVCPFEPQMRTDTQRRAALESALRRATERDELFVVYQPVVDLPTGRVIGAEALLRWSHPDLGDVTPAEFIPIAEETGLIEPLGWWVLEEACRRVKLWDATGLIGPDFTMAINVSTCQLRTHDLPTRLREALERSGLEPSRVILEVTESAMHEDQEAFVEVLRRLRGIGVHLSVDDFGTGYSSLAYLRRLPVTSVKLDRAFVDQVAVPPNDAIARAVQGIAAALGLVVIAEGVENEAQRDALRRLRVDQAQGYLWGRPMLPKDFLAHLVPAQRRPAQPGPAQGGPAQGGPAQRRPAQITARD